MYVLGPIIGIFLKIHIWETTHVRYKLYKFGCTQYIIKDILCVFTCISAANGDFAENLYLGHNHMFVTNDVSLTLLHQIKGPLHEDQYIFYPCLLCHWRDFPQDSSLGNYTHLLQTS